MESLLFSKILPKAEAKEEFFWALEIEVDKVKVAACQIKEGEIEILGVAGSGHGGSWEEITASADEAISQVEEKFPKISQVNQVILGLPSQYTQEGKISEPHLTDLKNLLAKLSLIPLGFVEIPLAITHLLKKQEGGPQTLILVRVGQNLTVSLVRVGKISGTVSSPRSQNLAADLEGAITSFSGVEVLPSRILLYNGENLEEARQSLIAHPWLSRLSFLHFPKIEIAPADLDIRAVAFAGAGEIAQTIEKVPLVKTEEVKEPSLPQASPEAETVDFGFVKGEDILEKVEAQKGEELKMPPLPPKFAPSQEAPEPSKRAWPKLALPQIELRRLIPVQKIKEVWREKIGWAILGGIFLFLFTGAALTAAYWYLPTAEVELILKGKTLEQTLELVLNPKLTTADEANKEIPALTLETEERGAGKTTTTGQKLVGEEARGEVTIYNKTANSKTFKKGTILLSASNLKFSLDEEVAVASASESIGSLTFGKQNARLGATTIGPEGNLGVGQEFHFADFPTTSYSARNETALSGGTSRQISVVSRSDEERLVASLSSELKNKARENLGARLSPGEKILEPSLAGVVLEKKFDQEVDQEATELNLTLAMRFSGLGFKEDDLFSFFEKESLNLVPAGFELRRGEVKTEILSSEKRKDGTVFLKAKFVASLLPRVNEEEIKKNLAGKNLGGAEEYLQSLGNLSGFEIRFGRKLPFSAKTLPRLGKNIKIETRGSR